MKTPSKSCELDPVSTSMIKQNIDIFVPYIRPLIKIKEVFKNYRAVANLKYLGKVIERVVSSRISDHIHAFNLSDVFQSAYKPYEVDPFEVGPIRSLAHSKLGPFEVGPIWSWAHSELGTFGVEPIRSWAHSKLGPFGVGPIRSWAHSKLGPFEVGPIRGWTYSKLGPFEVGPIWSWAQLRSWAGPFEVG